MQFYNERIRSSVQELVALIDIWVDWTVWIAANPTLHLINCTQVNYEQVNIKDELETYKYNNAKRTDSPKVTKLYLCVVDKTSVCEAAVCCQGEVTFIRGVVHISALQPN